MTLLVLDAFRQGRARVQSSAAQREGSSPGWVRSRETRGLNLSERLFGPRVADDRERILCHPRFGGGFGSYCSARWLCVEQSAATPALLQVSLFLRIGGTERISHTFVTIGFAHRISLREENPWEMGSCTNWSSRSN